MTNIQVSIEFTGLARDIVGQAQLELSLDQKATFGDIVQILAELYPGLVGILIDNDGRTFLSSNMFIINDDLACPAMIMADSPHDGDHLTLVSVITGG
jgi:molybdopterin converting factor small subunit